MPLLQVGQPAIDDFEVGLLISTTLPAEASAKWLHKGHLLGSSVAVNTSRHGVWGFSSGWENGEQVCNCCTLP